MDLKRVYLFITVALTSLAVVLAEYEWSGFVNNIEDDFDYVCEDNLAISGIASVFDDTLDDRRWEYQCASGGGVANVTSTCTLQDPINSYQAFLDFECPSGGFISGVKSTHSNPHSDRQWQPYCCTRPYTSLVNCDIPTSHWENNVETLLNWTTTDGRVLTGMQSFYAAFNRDRRWRFKQCTLEVSCGDPGVPLNAVREGDSFLYQDEVVFTCNHGYYQSSGAAGGRRVCLDTGLWSDSQPVCTSCTDIDNCADIRCTSPSNQYCVECESDQGYGLGERGFVNLNTSCSPLCSWLQSFCYPGECPGDYLSCNCSEGFAGLDCLTITDEPDLNSCDVTITSPDHVTSECEINSTQNTYIDFIPTQVSVDFDTSFMFTDPPPKPAYVQSYRLGISTVEVTTAVYRMNSYPSSAASTTSSPCSPNNPSPDNPLMMVDCTNSDSNLGAHTFLHGDWFEVGVSISNGGHLNITDLDSNETTPHYYSGTQIFPYSLFVIDLLPPTHCSIEKSLTCLTDQVMLSESLVSTNRVRLTWGGWYDTPSQVQSYQVEIFKLVYNSSMEVLNTGMSPVYTTSYTAEEALYNYTSSPLLDEGPYSVILTVTDTAGNSQYTRRILVYDDDSQLLEDLIVPLVISSGVAEGGANHYWHNSTTEPIVVSGRGHFYNENLKTDNWLAPAEPHSPAVLAVFDDEDRYGVNNSLGITALHYQYIVDQEAGESGVNQPATFPYQTQDLALDSVEVSPTGLKDGDSVNIWFEAHDFKNNTPVYESVLVHIDSTPPAIGNLGLVKDGVEHLVFLYGFEALVDLDISFESTDVHSGIDAIHWTLSTDLNTVGEGEAPVTVIDKDECLFNLTDCVCDIVDHCHSTKHSINIFSTDFLHDDYSSAIHDTDYYLTVSVTNHAQLVASITEKFTVDLTKPLPGKVYETNTNTNTRDIDYQTTPTFTIEWSEFRDHESDIITYQYIIDTQCSNASAFQYPNLGNSKALSTTNTTIQWTAAHQGVKYYTTVVAYNGAYIASDPVCSDGVTIDSEPPLFTGMHVPQANVREGLVASGGEVWVIHGNRERSKVDSPGLACVNKSLGMSEEELAAFPIQYSSSSNISLVLSEDCSDFLTFDPHTYTPIDTVFNISWSAIDNVGIRDYQLGIASNRNLSLTSPDVMPFTSTAGFTHYSIHWKLFQNSSDWFYVSVKAIDLSMHETITITGPIIIDTSPPVLNGTVVSKEVDELVIISWEEGRIVDEEDIFPLTYQYSIGRTQFSDSVSPFSPVPSSQHHPDCLSGPCILLNTTDLGFLKGNTYHVTISVVNTAGLYLYVPVNPTITMPFTLDSSCISVFEYPSGFVDMVENPRSYFSEQYDHDIVLEGDNMTVAWYGLDEEHYNTSFYVGVGSKPGLTDIVPFTSAGDLNHVELPAMYQFELFHTYYCIVKAVNAHSVIYKSSDGFQFIPDVTDDAGVWSGLSDTGNQLHQLSGTEVSAHWYFPPSVTQLVSHYEWALYEYDNLTQPVLEYENVGTSQWGLRGIADLKREHTAYVASVRACFKGFCLDDIYSDEFRVAQMPDSTKLTILKAEYKPKIIDSYGYSSSGQLYVTWKYSSNDIVKYQWSVGTSPSTGEEILTDWTDNAHHTTVNVTYTAAVNLHKHHYVTIRGFNTAGLEAHLITDLVFIGDYTINDVIVYDVTEDFVPDQNQPIEFTQTEYTELDYTSTSSSLSAVWPSLRYTVYNYSLTTNRKFQPCTGSDVISCGNTQYNGITINNLNLTHGVTYYICVRAEADDAFTPYPSGPKTVESCSNGIMAYRTPPTGTCVQIRPLYDDENLPNLTPYELLVNDEYIESPQSCVYEPGSQSATDSIRIVWNQFTDTVTNGDFPYESRVAYYEYGIGSTPGAVDVVQYTRVGVVNAVYVTGLELEHGITYYATIRATSLAGTQSVFTSHGLTVDLTPPTFSNLWINSETAISVNTAEDLTMHWGSITDSQSGLSRLYWSLGSEEGLGDLYGWTEVDTTATGVTVEDPLFHVRDGQPIVLNIKAINNAGISSTDSSSLIIYDSTLPCSGRVFNGPKPSPSLFIDLDYTSEHSTLSAHWEPFTDPHTSISEYKLAVGSCAGCEDVSPYISTGLLTDIRRSLSLKQGHTYFVSVQGCSMYSGCVTSHSDSLTVDVTGPVTQRVKNGLPQSIINNFQASRHTISAHWSGIHDTESTITHYSYYIGASPGDNSIIPKRTIPPSARQVFESAPFDNGWSELPIDQLVYITLEVYNGAGMSSTVTSSGIVVSDVSLVINQMPYIDYDWSGSAVNDTQYVNSALRIRWNITDSNLVVDKYFWRIMFEDRTYQLLQPQISYHSTHQTLLQVDLPDGAILSAVVIACNQAGICIYTQTHSTVFIDSSPPVNGYFAVETDSAANLSWAIEDGMIITNGNITSTLNLTFTSFADTESGIIEYWATVGSVYMNNDLYKSNEPLTVTPSSYTGILSSHIELNQTLSNGDKVYISLWAVNGVGVSSRIVQGTFEAVMSLNNSNGGLKLLRSQLCPVESCEGHCTCGEAGKMCDYTGSCTVRSQAELMEWEKAKVTNFVPQASSPGYVYTAVSDKLVASVELPTSSYRFTEWSVGEKGKDAGSGVIDTSSDPVWFPLVSQGMVIFDVSDSHPLVLGKMYVFYVRVWYNASNYTRFESSGVIFDDRSPMTNKGYRIKEVESVSSNRDIDFIGSTSEVFVRWSNVYDKRYATAHALYELCLGLSPGSDEVFACIEVDNTTNHYSFTGLSLTDNTQYYTVLRVTTSTGAESVAISDGFTVDLTAPDIGAVFDGKYFTDESGHTTSSSSYVHVLGFNDPHSGIKGFHTKVSFSNGESEVSYTDNEIARVIKIEHMGLAEGNASYVSVVASNAAGVNSSPVISTGSIYDTSPPRIHECTSTHVAEPSSFDTNEENCYCLTDAWSFSGEYSLLYIEEILNWYKTVPVDNCCALKLMPSSSLSRSFNTTIGIQYTLSFWVLVDAKAPTELLIESQGAAGTADMSKKTILRPTCNGKQHRWQKLDYIITATSTVSTISIMSPPHQSILIDSIELQYCSAITPTDKTTFTTSHYTRPDTITWPVYDTQSGVHEYMYAIGTVKGGIQISDYRSMGRTNWAFHDLWNSVDTSAIHFSVKATNGAGLSAVYYSEPIIIDKTAPVVIDDGVKEVLETRGTDEDYTSSHYILLDWTNVVDNETGIMHCVWGLGSAPSLIDIKNYTISKDGFVNLTLPSDYYHPSGITVYTTVTCLNRAGLAASATSDGLVFISSPPKHDQASITVYNPALTECSAMDGYVSANSVQVVWDEFIEDSGAPLYYQMKLIEHGVSQDSVQWKEMGLLKQVTVSNLTLLERDVEHVVMVRAYSVKGLYSEAVKEEFVLVSSEPTVHADSVKPNVTQVNGSLTVQWKDLFTTVGPLYYEVSIGNQLGGGSIRKFVTTENDFIQVDGTEIKESGTYFVSLKAINYAGLSSHMNYMINGEMAFEL